MQITLSVPEQYLLTENASELGHRVLLYAALLMYRSGELSAGSAAEFAGVDRLVLHVGDASGRTSVEGALALVSDLATAANAAELTARIEALGLAWGVSDGN